jgi:hypothetical protein
MTRKIFIKEHFVLDFSQAVQASRRCVWLLGNSLQIRQTQWSELFNRLAKSRTSIAYAKSERRLAVC